MIVGLAVLGGFGVLLLAAFGIGARHAHSVVVGDAAGHRAGWSALHGGLDPSANPMVRWWLGVVRQLALPLARSGAAPDVLSLFGVWLAAWVLPAGAAGHRWALLGALAIAAGGVADALDGAVAVVADRATPHGALLDGVADRVSDAIVLCGLWLLGAPGWLVLAAGVSVLALEGTRRLGVRRVGGAGGPITPGERPTRLILAGLGFLAAGIFDVPGFATVAAAATLAVCAVSVGALVRAFRSRSVGR
jgi:phosphatidylglycerophosphate synthase